MGRPGRKPSTIIGSGPLSRGPDMIHNVIDRRYDPPWVGSWEVLPLIYDMLMPEDVGSTVIFRKIGSVHPVEAGTISSWRDGLVFVRFSSGNTAAGCRPEDLLRGMRTATPRGYEPAPLPREPDTSDIPEEDEEWFKRAKLRTP